MKCIEINAKMDDDPDAEILTFFVCFLEKSRPFYSHMVTKKTLKKKVYVREKESHFVGEILFCLAHFGPTL